MRLIVPRANQAGRNEMTSASHCHGFGCGSTSLIKAHLVAQSFGRLIKSPKGPNTRITGGKSTTKAQHGLFDPRILCYGCDGFLNKKYDDPAFKFISKFKYRPGELDLERSHFEKLNVDCDMLCGFILSVLWRCSISQMLEVSHISLGQYGNPVREMLWGHRSLASFNHYKVMVQRYHDRPGVQKMYSLPMPVEFEDVSFRAKGYLFVLAGFRFMVILDPQPLPGKYASYVLNGNDALRGSLIDFPTTYEANVARELVQGAQRKSVTLPGLN
jgi:hypothetical protein